MLGYMASLIDRPFDLEDLLGTPDDGNRYEVLDGALVVTPPPGPDHQAVVAELLVILHRAARPLGLRVFPAPLAWRIAPGQVPEPDLMVVTPDAIGARAIERPPLLVVEVLSPTGRDRDLSEKRRVYAQASAPTYWIVDPVEPSLTVLRLAGTDYDQEAHVIGTSAYETSDPLTCRIVPAELIS